jgi:hypothetical protein
MPKTTGLLLLVLCAVAGCRDKPPKASSPPPPPRGAIALPALDGFAAGPEERGAGYVRRTYAREGDQVTVTLAQFAMSAPQYDQWLRMSADYPQAELGLAAGEGNGFFECAAGDPSRCNLLLQLRRGVHVEIRGQGVARRRDAEAIARGLDLPGLVARLPPAGL